MTLEEFRPFFQDMIIGNCGYTPDAAEASIAAGHADIIAFGRSFITNPYLPERIRNGWPLVPAEDMSLWYTPGAPGYTDYPAFE